MKKTDENEWLNLRELLTRDGDEWVNTDAGKARADRQGLLRQLRTAVFAGMENTGGAAAFGSKPPLDAAAIDLLEEITDQATQVLVAVTHRPVPLGHAEDYVDQWAGNTDEKKRFTVEVRATVPNFVYDVAHPERAQVELIDVEYTALELLRHWVSRCEDFFNPPNSREIAADCPYCGARHVRRMKDGQWIQSAALNILRDRETGAATEAKCGACGVSWAPSQFGILAELVGATAADPLIDEKVKEKALVMSESCFDGEHVTCRSVACRRDCHLNVGRFAAQHAA